MTQAAVKQVFAPSQPGLVPAAVARQAAEANRLIAELNAPPPAAPAPGVAPAAAPPPAPAPPAPAAAPPPAAMAPTPPAPPPKPVDWEARFKVLQGKYNTEMPRAQQRLDSQQELINNLVAKQATPAQAPAPAMSDEDKLLALGVKPKQIEEFGVELLMLMMNLGSAAVSPSIQRLEQETQRLGETAQHLTSVGTQRSQEAVYASLNEHVPNWDAINRSEEFKEWLSFIDIFAGTTKHVALTDAFKKCDAKRVVAIFQAFEREDAARAPAAPSVDPATLLAPAAPRGEAPAAPDGSGKKIWLESEVRDFYTAVRKKKTTPEEYERVSKELALAAKEGRIKPDNFDHHGNKN